MRVLIGLVTLTLSGCAIPRDVFLHDKDSSVKPAIVGVSGVDAKLELVDAKPFETYLTRGAILRVHVNPGTHTFGVIALENIGLGYGTASYTKAMSEVSAEVLPGHVYGFRSALTAGGRRFWIVDLGTEIDPACFRPQFQNGGYASQTCHWP